MKSGLEKGAANTLKTFGGRQGWGGGGGGVRVQQGPSYEVARRASCRGSAPKGADFLASSWPPFDLQPCAGTKKRPVSSQRTTAQNHGRGTLSRQAGGSGETPAYLVPPADVVDLVPVDHPRVRRGAVLLNLLRK